MIKNRMLIAGLIGISLTGQAGACTTILVGQRASADGSSIIARNEDHD